MIVPVIDIKDGKAVMPIAGRRDEYEELKSVICRSSDPLDVAVTYERLGFREIYLADLDGILYSNPDLDLINEIARSTGLSIMADIGLWSPETLLLSRNIRPIIATETFSSLNLLEFPKEVILGIDTRGDRLLSETSLDLFDFIEIIKDSRKITEIILQDLDRVGILKGPNLDLCKRVIDRLPDKKIIYGGGIRDLRDIDSMQRIGVYKVLVGSALHTGRIFKDVQEGDYR